MRGRRSWRGVGPLAKGKMRNVRIQGWILALCGCLLVSTALAHDPVHNLIAAKTAEIEACDALSGGTVDAELHAQRALLLCERSSLYRQLRDWDRSLVDLATARQSERAARTAAGAPTLGEQLATLPAAIEFEHALLYWDLEWLRSCELHVNAYVTLSPKDPKGHALLGRVLFATKRYLGSAAEFGRVIKLTRSRAERVEPDMYLRRAEALAHAGSAYLDEAIEGLDEGLAELGDVVSLQLYALELEQNAQLWDAALRRVERSIARSRRPEVWWVRRGELLCECGRLPEARQSFATALQQIDALPGLRRRVPAVEKLRQRVQRGIERLGSSGTGTNDSGGGGAGGDDDQDEASKAHALRQEGRD